MAPRILISLIAMDANNSFYVKSIATYAPTFFGYIISVLANVQRDWVGGVKKLAIFADVQYYVC